jgi:hypothetical protein
MANTKKYLSVGAWSDGMWECDDVSFVTRERLLMLLMIRESSLTRCPIERAFCGSASLFCRQKWKPQHLFQPSFSRWGPWLDPRSTLADETLLARNFESRMARPTTWARLAIVNGLKNSLCSGHLLSMRPVLYCQTSMCNE